MDNLTITFTRGQMAKEVNNWLTGLVETITHSGESEIHVNSSYTIIRKWMNAKGEIVQFNLLGKYLVEGYWNYNKETVPTFILNAEKDGNTDLLQRLFRHIKEI